LREQLLVWLAVGGRFGAGDVASYLYYLYNGTWRAHVECYGTAMLPIADTQPRGGHVR